MDPSDFTPPSVSDQTLFVWSAPLRPFKKRSTTLLRFFLAMALLISALVFFFGDLVTVVPIWALLFLFYIFAITPPPIIENRLTVFGVETAGVMLRWDALSHYYFDERLGYRLVVLVTHGPYYAHSYLVIPNEEIMREVSVILNQHLMCLSNPPKTLVDKITKFMYGLIPEEQKSSTEAHKATT